LSPHALPVNHRRRLQLFSTFFSNSFLGFAVNTLTGQNSWIDRGTT